MTRRLFCYRPSSSNGLKVCEEGSVYKARGEGRLVRRTIKPRLIDLFAGAGGMTLGFTKAFGHCFEVVWANDFDKSASATYCTNFGPHCVVGDIVDILRQDPAHIPRADVVIGGPPCQGFSLLNKNRIADPRKQLWRPFLDVVRTSGASVFVMENVPQLLGSPEHSQIVTVAAGAGFKTSSAKLCAADYGTPQTRWRAFIIGCNFVDPSEVFPPKKSHYDPRNGYAPDLFEANSEFLRFPKPWRTVRDAIADLPAPEGTEIRSVPPPLDLHFTRKPTASSMKRYRAIPKEGMKRFDLQKCAPDLTPACCIRKDSSGEDLFVRLFWRRPATALTSREFACRTFSE